MGRQSRVISILICTRNRADSLRETLQALAQVCMPKKWAVEVIVVDNGSTDATPQVVAECQLKAMTLRHIVELEPGLCCARNAGLRAAQGNVIVLLDDDVRPAEEWLLRLCSPLVEGQADAATGMVAMASHLRRDWMRAPHLIWLAEVTPADLQVEPPLLIGANMVFRREVLTRVPGFDEELDAGRLGFAGDTLFAMQLHLAGYRVLGVPEACVEHHFDPSRLLRRSFADMARKHGRSGAYLTHHWKRETLRWAGLRQIRVSLLYALYYIQHWRECRSLEGMSEREMELRQYWHYLNHYRIEKKRRPNYTPQALCKNPVG